jgi:hypothetical protein
MSFDLAPVLLILQQSPQGRVLPVFSICFLRPKFVFFLDIFPSQ